MAAREEYAGLGLSSGVAAKRLAIDQGQQKSEKYWEVYKTTNLVDALDPAKGLLASPLPTYPPPSPSEWLSTSAEQRLGAALDVKSLHYTAHEALQEAEARASFVSVSQQASALSSDLSFGAPPPVQVGGYHARSFLLYM